MSGFFLQVAGLGAAMGVVGLALGVGIMTAVAGAKKKNMRKMSYSARPTTKAQLEEA